MILHGLGWALGPSRQTFRSRASCALRSATESFFLITKGKKCKVKFFLYLAAWGGFRHTTQTLCRNLRPGGDPSRPSGAAPAVRLVTSVHAALSRARSCADHHRDLKPPQIFTSPIDVLNTCFFLKSKIQPGLNIVFLEEAGIGLLSGLELQFISHAVACKLKQRDIVSV